MLDVLMQGGKYEDDGFIAGVKQKQIVSTTTIGCGLRNPKFFELIIDFVTKSLMQRDPWVCQLGSNHILG